MPEIDELTTDEKVLRARQEFPGIDELAYFATGTYGRMAERVWRNVQERVARYERLGVGASEQVLAAIETARGRLAERIGAAPLEVALTRNATDGVNLVAAGLTLAAGDEVLISDQEHPAMSYPWAWAARARGVVVRRFRVEHDPAETLSNVAAGITDRTRVVGANWVTSPYGIRLPAREICTMARERGALSLVDGAQVFGVIPVDVGALGCDFFTSNGHKWLGGPKGTGFFWARPDLMSRLRPAHVGAGAASSYSDGDGLELWPDARRFEYGTTARALWGGLIPALDWFDELEWGWIERRIATLADYLKGRLGEVPGVRLSTPRRWEVASGLTTFVADGVDQHELVRGLRENWRVMPQPLSHAHHVRVSTAFYNTREEIDRLVDGVARTVARARQSA